jgi:hypothetical protein
MARYGKVLLQRLTFQYCDRMGSSRGMRWAAAKQQQQQQDKSNSSSLGCCANAVPLFIHA